MPNEHDATPPVLIDGLREPNTLRDDVLGILRRWDKDDDYDIDTCIRHLRAALSQSRAEDLPKKQALHLALLSLKPEERREVMAQFCSYCGSDDPLCQCLKEE